MLKREATFPNSSSKSFSRSRTRKKNRWVLQFHFPPAEGTVMWGEIEKQQQFLAGFLLGLGFFLPDSCRFTGDRQDLFQSLSFSSKGVDLWGRFWWVFLFFWLVGLFWFFLFFFFLFFSPLPHYL